MKKSLLSLSILVALFSTGCEDKVSIQKLQEAENNIVQLESQLKEAQSEVTKLQAEIVSLATLKSEYDALKIELDKALTRFPALNVEVISLFNKSEMISFPKDPKDEYAPESSRVELSVSIAKTGVEWLDQLLLKEVDIRSNNTAHNPVLKTADMDTSKPLTLERFTQSLSGMYEAMLAEVKENKEIGLTQEVQSRYLGQRNNIVSFSILNHVYSGGAHGMYRTDYLNIDTDKQAVITLNDFIAPNNQESVKSKLWERYAEERRDESGEFNGSGDKNTFRLSENFYFTPHGVSFVYPPYELGSYDEGEVEVMLEWYEINSLLQPSYRLAELNDKQ